LHNKALEDEVADLLGHVLLLAHRYDLDLEAAVQRKWRFQLPPCGSAGCSGR
jgi:NTP pyrophosphatase (non-canonical NTP hydrolase)